jgi:hypothetical protein
MPFGLYEEDGSVVMTMVDIDGDHRTDALLSWYRPSHLTLIHSYTHTLIHPPTPLIRSSYTLLLIRYSLYAPPDRRYDEAKEKALKEEERKGKEEEARKERKERASREDIESRARGEAEVQEAAVQEAARAEEAEAVEQERKGRFRESLRKASLDSSPLPGSKEAAAGDAAGAHAAAGADRKGSKYVDPSKDLKETRKSMAAIMMGSTALGESSRDLTGDESTPSSR